METAVAVVTSSAAFLLADALVFMGLRRQGTWTGAAQ
jgi:hypothetical protein